jgi:general secretion pathway protein M
MKSAVFNEWKQRAAAFWSGREKREQNLLVAAAVVIVAGLFYLLLIDPALSGRRILEKQLPALRQQAAQMQALAREASGLSGKAAAPVPALSREAVESSLAAKGLTAQNLAVTGELVKLQMNGVSFANTVDWLQEVHKSLRLSVTDASVEAQQPADTVNANLTLHQQRGDAQ